MLSEQQDHDGPSISGRGQGWCPVHEQDQAGHPYQAAAQASNVQVVRQDGQACQERVD